MAEATFNTKAGQTINREMLITCLNVGTYESPKWAPVGRRVEDSTINKDYSIESIMDIFGDTYTTGKKATNTQTFDPWPLDSGDEAHTKIALLSIVDDDISALTSQDMLIVHTYLDYKDGVFAERYPNSSVVPTGNGGEGGGVLSMPIEVTYGGIRAKGSATVSGGTITFTED